MGLVVKKKISLDFLGDEYKDSYIVVKSISVGEYETLVDSDITVRDAIKDRFIEGKIQQEDKVVDITLDNLLDLPGEVFVKAFAYITGQEAPTSLREA